MKGGAKILALFEDGQPRQAGLKALQDELFEQRAIVALGHAPFLVVVARIFGIGDADPGAAPPVDRRHSASGRVGGAISKRAQSGLLRRTGTASALMTRPLARASAARSRRRSASARPPSTEPIDPRVTDPAVTAALPARAAAPSTMTTRLRPPPRCCMRLATSCPMKQPLLKETPFNWSKLASCRNVSPSR